MVKYMAVAVAVAVSGSVALPVAVPVAVPVAGLTKRCFNHIQKDFLINVWGYESLHDHGNANNKKDIGPRFQRKRSETINLKMPQNTSAQKNGTPHSFGGPK